MSDRRSLAEEAIAVLGEIGRMCDGVGNDHPGRWPLRKMKMAAEQAVHDGLHTAGEIIEAARAVKEQLSSTDTEQGSCQAGGKSKGKRG